MCFIRLEVAEQPADVLAHLFALHLVLRRDQLAGGAHEIRRCSRMSHA